MVCARDKPIKKMKEGAARRSFLPNTLSVTDSLFLVRTFTSFFIFHHFPILPPHTLCLVPDENPGSNRNSERQQPEYQDDQPGDQSQKGIQRTDEPIPDFPRKTSKRRINDTRRQGILFYIHLNGGLGKLLVPVLQEGQPVINLRSDPVQFDFNRQEVLDILG